MKKWLSKLATLTSILLITGYILYSPQQAFAQVKKVEVDLTKQRIYALEDNKVIYNFLISSGKSRTPTVAGTFQPYYKTLSTRMIGGSYALGDFYDLPNVPYVVFFSGGYSMHGTYWHNNFGYPMSHGCINMRTTDARIIYNWIDYSTPISIYGVTPKS